jgi:hypothetical protein
MQVTPQPLPPPPALSKNSIRKHFRGKKEVNDFQKLRGNALVLGSSGASRSL